MQRWFLWLMRVGNETGNQIDQKVIDAAMAGMLDLRNVLELVIDGFNDGSFAKKQFVRQRDQAVLHVLAQRGDQLKALCEQLFKQSFGDVAPVTEQLTEQVLAQQGNRFPVVDIAWGQVERQAFTPVIDHQMELEAIEPAHRCLSPFCETLEDLVALDPAVVANSNRGGVNERDTGAITQAQVQIHHQGDQDTWHQFYETIVADQPREFLTQVPLHRLCVECLEVSIM